MSHSLPPIIRLSERLLVDIEQAVRTFPRYTKYTVGTDLRRAAMEVATLATRAWTDRKRTRKWTQRLVWSIDQLKLCLQLGKRLQAFKSFAQFEALSRLAVDLGRQAFGWHRQQSQQHPTGQNPERIDAPERAHTLSTRATPNGVNA